MTELLLDVKDLAVSFDGRQVSHVPRLELPAGVCVAIVGESGSGKSSALRAMLGLVDSRATVTGSVRLRGRELVGLDEREWRTIRGQELGLIAQSPLGALSPTMKLGRLARLALRRHGHDRVAATALIAESMDAVWLPVELLDRYPHQISGGQAQRFAIALSLALGVRCLLADEPTSALDVTVQAEVVRLLNTLREDKGVGIVFVTHDIALVPSVADDIIVMKEGRTVEQGRCLDVLLNASSDYTRDLVDAAPTLGEAT